MAYTPPAVLVFQQFVSPSPVLAPPDLDALIVGPNYQVLDKEPIIPKAVVTGTKAGAFTFVESSADTLDIAVDGGITKTVTFADGATTIANTVIAINAVFAGLASDDGTGKVKLTASTSIDIKATSTALTVLGFTAAVTTATVYNPTLGNVISYPGLELGAVVDLTSNLDVYFNDVVATIVAMSAVGSVVKDGNILTDAGNTFITKGVGTEDRIKLTNPVTGLVELYIVDTVLSETTIKVFGKFEYSTNEVIGTVAEPYAPGTGVDDALSIKVDGGAPQSITLATSDTTAALVATKISAGLTGATASATSDDKVKIVSDATNGSIEIATVANDAYTILGLTVGSSLASYKINNDIKDYTEVKIRNPIDNVDPNTDFAVSATQITLDPGIKVYATAGQSYAIESAGSIGVTYRALRTAGSAEIVDIESLDEIQGKLGVIDVRNPLAVGASIALQNTVNRIRTFAIDEDTSQGYLEVLDRIQDTDEVYAITPLTQDTTVAASYKSHVDSMSLPENGRWRKMIWSPALIKEKTVQELSGDGDFQYVDSTTTLTMEDITNGAFITSNVVVGDYMRVKDKDTSGSPQTHAGVYKITEVISEQKIKLENITYTGTAGSGSYTAGVAYSGDFLDVSIDYEVFRILDKTGIADAMAALAESYKDSRVHQVLSDQVDITLSDGDHTVPGYYLCAAIAGMVAGAPPHQGFTNLGISGIKTLYNSNRYFSQTQLNKMAEKGVYIVVQDTLGSLPYSRHQVSTDTTILELQEMSVGKTVDFVSYFFKRRLKSVLGVYNVTPSTLGLVTTISNAILVYLKENALPKIGSVILQTSEIISVKQDDTFKDQINVVIGLDVPFPVNRIRVDLLI